MEPKAEEPLSTSGREQQLRKFRKAGKMTHRELKEGLESLHGWPELGLKWRLMVKDHEFEIKYINEKTHELVLISTKSKSMRI